VGGFHTAPCKQNHPSQRVAHTHSYVTQCVSCHGCHRQDEVVRVSVAKQEAHSRVGAWPCDRFPKMGDDAYRHNTHHHHAGHKKGSFLNKLFARQSSLKAAIGYGPSRGDHECSEKDDEGRASSPSRQQGEHQGSRFHFPHSPLSSSTPIFSSIRTRAGTKVGTEGLTGGRGGTREKSGAIRDCGTGEERLTGRFLPPLTPAASASVKIALDFLG